MVTTGKAGLVRAADQPLLVFVEADGPVLLLEVVIVILHGEVLGACVQRGCLENNILFKGLKSDLTSPLWKNLEKQSPCLCLVQGWRAGH